MIPFPKSRGFLDYAISALVMSGVLLILFSLETGEHLVWADAAVAGLAALLFVAGVILVRRAEKATWIAHPTWRNYLLACVGGSALVFGAIYADAYLLHPKDLTAKRLRGDSIIVVSVTIATLWSARKRAPVKSQSI